MADRDTALAPFDALIGTWVTEATHPMFDGVVPGRATFEWLEGGRFLIQRSHNDHDQFPDAIGVIGAAETGDGLVLEYFDSRGVRRTYGVSLDDGVLRIWRDAPGFDQRLSASLGHDSFEGRWQLARTPGDWQDDLKMTYRRADQRRRARNDMGSDGEARIRTLWEDAFNGRDLDVLDAVTAPGFVNRNALPGTPPGPEGHRAVVQRLWKAFPDARFEIEHLARDGDTVICVGTMSGTHEGTLLGIPATGRKVEWRQCHLYRLDAGGRAVEHDAIRDDAGLLRQFGARVG